MALAPELPMEYFLHFCLASPVLKNLLSLWQICYRYGIVFKVFGTVVTDTTWWSSVQIMPITILLETICFLMKNKKQRTQIVYFNLPKHLTVQLIVRLIVFKLFSNYIGPRQRTLFFTVSFTHPPSFEIFVYLFTVVLM